MSNALLESEQENVTEKHVSQQFNNKTEHLPKKAREPRIRFSSTAIIVLCITLLAMVGVNIWYMLRQEAAYQDMVLTIDLLTSTHEYDEAEFQAKRKLYHWDSIAEAVQNILSERNETNHISELKQKNVWENGKTTGRSDEGFLGLIAEDAKDWLVKCGFSEDRIRLSPLVDDKYKKYEEGRVVKIRIDNQEDFESDAKFLPNVYIEIYYKENDKIESENEAEAFHVETGWTTIGTSSKDFEGLTLSEALTRLKERGFTETIETIEDHSVSFITKQKYRKSTEGIVLSIRINETEKFGDKERFPIDASIELFYYQPS